MPVSEQEQALLTEHTLEQALDKTIDALMVLDSPVLVELANLCAVWGASPIEVPFAEEQRERMQAKLVLLGRLLRHTEVSLHLLGVPLGSSSATQPHWVSGSTQALTHWGI